MNFFYVHVHVLFLFILLMIHEVYSANQNMIPDWKSEAEFVLACGGSSINSADSNGRNWMPDSKFLTLTSENNSNDSISAIAETQDPSLPSTVPYMAARFFRAKSSYKFTNISSNNRHWIRLHFYPSIYQDFNLSYSFFSLTVAGFTLLNNFSALITSQALTQAYIVREFTLIPVDSGNLVLTFTPSSAYNDSFAFVNGIEIISMPPQIFESATFVGLSDSNQVMDIRNNTMQTMFRLNVGGQFIPPSNDSGLSRTWYDDSPYLFGAASGITTQAEKNDRIQYDSAMAEYIAPIDVYRTSRSMGPDAKVNQNYNLTWVFDVDVNYTYLLRFHFCEYAFSRINQRVFDILVNNQTAFQSADVIAWANGKNVPVYKDFAIYLTDKSGGELWVALRPNGENKPEYYDVILNGLEIFKINDEKGNLAGPNPVPPPLVPVFDVDDDTQQHSRFGWFSSSHHRLILGAVSGAVVGFVAIVCSIALFRYRMRKNNRKLVTRGWLPIYVSSSHSSRTGSPSSRAKNSSSSNISNIGGSICRRFSLNEIIQGTENFDESHVIGIGGFGKVYRCYIDGNSKVAIKRSNPSSEQGIHEFETEIDLLSKLRHRHLVSLIGACEEDNEMILVYDYMANGTLREHLYKTKKKPLSWKKRLEICIGSARGLHYLHTGAKHTIIHRDVKTTNILLDEKWVAKVSDFGLSKTGPAIDDQTHVSTVVKGSFGYLDPEYFKRQQLTEKSDVYSFGVVLFEVLCGRAALEPNLPKEQVSLADWAIRSYAKGTLNDIVDSHIKHEITPECFEQFTEIASKCLSEHGTARPPMATVLWHLEYCLQLQNNPNGSELTSKQKASYACAIHQSLLTVEEEEEEEKFDEGKEDEEYDNSNTFSQIVNPQAR